MKTQKVSKNKKSSRKKRTSKRIMIGGRRLSPNDVAYLQSMVFQVEPEPEEDEEEEGYDDYNDYDEDDDDDGTETWSYEVYDEIGTHLDRDFLDTVIDFAGFGSLNNLRRNYPTGYIPYFNQEGWNIQNKSTQGLYRSMSGFFGGHEVGVVTGYVRR